VIPDAAVEAAAIALAAQDMRGFDPGSFIPDARAALEAAAPHLLADAKAEAWDEGKDVRRCDGVPPNPYRSQA